MFVVVAADRSTLQRTCTRAGDGSGGRAGQGAGGRAGGADRQAGNSPISSSPPSSPLDPHPSLTHLPLISHPISSLSPLYHLPPPTVRSWAAKRRERVSPCPSGSEPANNVNSSARTRERAGINPRLKRHAITSGVNFPAQAISDKPPITRRNLPFCIMPVLFFMADDNNGEKYPRRLRGCVPCIYRE